MEEERPASAVLCARLFSRACHGLCGRPDILLGQAAKAQHQRRAGLAAPACVEIGAQRAGKHAVAPHGAGQCFACAGAGKAQHKVKAGMRVFNARRKRGQRFQKGRDTASRLRR